jgi:hypothetical protein
MRRRFLILTFLSTTAWSQPAPQQTHLPPVVKVEMPTSNPPNPWIHFAELILPGIIGASLALFGVWLTSRQNARTNTANRQHQLDVEIAKAKIAAEYRSRDSRWEFRKSVYTDLLTATTVLRGVYMRMALFSERNRTKSEDQVENRLKPLQDEQWSAAKPKSHGILVLRGMKI